MMKRIKTISRRARGPLAGAAATSALLLAQGCAPPPSDAVVKDAPEVESTARLNPNLATALDISRFHMSQLRVELGLDADHTFRARNMASDELGVNHIRYEQLYQGVRVWGGDAIVHVGADGSLRELTNDLKTNINVATRPSLSEAYALDRAHRDLRPQGAYAYKPTAELVVYPRIEERVKASTLRGPGGELNAEDIERVVTGYTLAYHVRTNLHNGVGETSQMEYLIDAHTGAILKKWNGLQTAAATGTGTSQYSGSVSINTNSITGGWELHDVARAMNYTTYNLNHATSGTGTVYTDADNGWGDGANYVEGSSTTAANGQTAGVDAHFGIGRTYDYYKNIHGRNGIDNANRATYNRVHYSNSYDNAFWDDTCFCMTYGDGSSFTTLTAIDVAGHEMTHGVTSRTAGLQYSGEPGGLNESTSDVHGTMVEYYARGGGTTTVPATGGNFTIGEQLAATPLRYMYKPSKDGASRDAWSSTLGSLDPHYSSGPGNRMFYFLSQGSSSSSTSDFYSSYLPGGMTGIGNDHAARIAYQGLLRMTSTTNYAGARTAYLAAATALYGSTSADYAAVENAFAAINVGSPHGGGGGGGTNVIVNPGFESGAVTWVQTAGVIENAAANAHSGSWDAYLNGYGTTHNDTLYQTVTVPSSTAQLCFWLSISTAETTTTTAFDTLQVQLRNSSNTVLTTLGTYSNLNKGAYTQRCFSVGSYNGQSVRVFFNGNEDSSLQTSFHVDDVSLQ
ncbi:MAG TPA: M4 family metallopeptidase [Polyangia bacterium]|jgi:Zn-dependent metalloprotease|nr:M4 family metallopeptidase [Polyangia bacterium]